MRSLQLYIFPLAGFLLNSQVRAAGPDSLALARYADSLFSQQDYYRAAVYYQKSAFFHNGYDTKAACLLKAANSCKLNKRYKEGVSILSAIDTGNLSERMTYDIKYQSALLAYLDGDFNLSETYLLQVSYLVKDSSLVFGSYLLHALVLNELFRWNEAREKIKQLNSYINKLDAARQTLASAAVDSMYSEKLVPRLKSVDKAVKLSTFFPGAGQTYAGYFGEGLFSFTAMAVLATGIVVGVINQYYFTSIFLGNMLIGKFYQGGIRRTEFLVEKRNYVNTRSYNQKLKVRLVSLFGK